MENERNEPNHDRSVSARQLHRRNAHRAGAPLRATEVLLRVKASTICGSDIRCIYHEHLGKGPEGYQGVIAGHEPCGQIVAAGPAAGASSGDRVIVYHISGCGVCNDCRRGYMISCTSEKYRRAYGWQRDGGMAEFMIAEEKDLIALPDELSYADGAQVACGFGTVYEGLEKIGINGNHAVLITGLGPVGLATGALCRKLGAEKIIGIDVVPERMKIAKDLGLCDEVLQSGPDNVAEVRALTGGMGVERASRLLRQRRGARHGHSRHPQMGQIRLYRRRRTRRNQSFARHDSRPENLCTARGSPPPG
jgi:threonine dehydrogenase-like Zn-dependent dehydrogenase